MPLISEGRERKRSRRWAMVALVVVGLLIAPPAGVLLAAVVVPLPQPFVWISGDRKIGLVGQDIVPAEVPGSELIPQGFSRQPFAFWLFRWGRRVWYTWH